MTASGFWIGVEAMPLSVLRAAAEHERPIFCGRLSLDQGLRAELGDLHERAQPLRQRVRRLTRPAQHHGQ